MPAPTKKGTGNPVKRAAEGAAEKAYGLIKKFAPKISKSLAERDKANKAKKIRGYRRGTVKNSRMKMFNTGIGDEGELQRTIAKKDAAELTGDTRARRPAGLGGKAARKKRAKSK